MLPMAIWNLDYFQSLKLNICLDLSTLQTLFLDYAIALYSLVLVIITYVLIELYGRGCKVIIWIRPFHRCCARFTRIMDIQSSIIKAFATLLLISYVKIMDSTLAILLPVQVYNVHQEVVGIYVFYDGCYKYFSKDHLPYAITAIIIFLVFVLSPLMLLFLYPMSCFQRCLSFCHLNNHILRTFVDAFQGHFKDGTEPGTRDCRWFAAVYFLGRIIVLYIIYAIVENITVYTLAGISLILLGMLMIILQPYKSRKVNTYHSMLIFIGALTCLFATVASQKTVKAHWIYDMALYSIALICLLPTLIAIVYTTYCIFYPCFKKYWQAFSQNRTDSNLESLLNSHGRE